MTKLKVPKKVGGVKLPKELRRQAKKAMKLTESPAVRELAMAGLALAAEKMIDRARPSGAAAREAAASMLDHGPGKTLKNSLAALDLGDMVRAAAVEGARRFLAGFEEGGGTRRARAAKPSAAKAKSPAKAKPAKARKAPARAAAAKPAKSAKTPGAAKPVRTAKAPARPAAAPKRKSTSPSAASRAAPARP